MLAPIARRLQLAENVDPLLALSAQFTSLQDQLSAIQQRYQALGVYHGQLCCSSLRNALVQLFEVIKYVDKSDRDLVDWHHRSKGLKIALRLVFMGRRTKAIVTKKTLKIKNKVSAVDQQIDETGQVFDNGVDAVKDLNAQFVQFSVSSVRATTSRAQTVCEQFDRDRALAEKQMEKQKRRSENIANSSQEVRQDLDEVQFTRMYAQTQRQGYNAVGSALFKPVEILTEPSRGQH